MGRTFKEKPWKYKNNKDFQKKQKQKHKNDKHSHPSPEINDGPFDDPPEYHESFA